MLGMYNPAPQPPLHDPEREATSRRVQSRIQRQRYQSMTTEQIVAEMGDKELRKNARKGAVMAVEELERRRANA